MAHKHSKSKKSKVMWYKDTQEGYGGVDEAEVYRTKYKGFEIMVFPTKLFDKDKEGWEYELWHSEKTPSGWVSLFETSTGSDHAKNPEIAKKWAINTVDEWRDDE